MEVHRRNTEKKLGGV